MNSNNNNNNNSSNNISENIESTGGFEFMLYTIVVAFTLAKNLDKPQQNLLGLFLQQVGGTLLSLSLYTTSIEDLCNINNSNTTNKPKSGYIKPLY